MPTLASTSPERPSNNPAGAGNAACGDLVIVGKAAAHVVPGDVGWIPELAAKMGIKQTISTESCPASSRKAR